jgi:hypothetical protein
MDGHSRLRKATMLTQVVCQVVRTIRSPKLTVRVIITTVATENNILGNSRNAMERMTKAIGDRVTSSHLGFIEGTTSHHKVVTEDATITNNPGVHMGNRTEIADQDHQEDTPTIVAAAAVAVAPTTIAPVMDVFLGINSPFLLSPNHTYQVPLKSQRNDCWYPYSIRWHRVPLRRSLGISTIQFRIAQRGYDTTLSQLDNQWEMR